MLSQLDLTPVNCNQLHLFTHIRLPPLLADTIFSSTHVYGSDRVSKTAIFGMFYRFGRTTYTVRAYIKRTKGQDYHVEYEYYDKKWPPLPKDMKPPQVLLDYLKPIFQDFVLYCNGHFTYSNKAAWTSAIELPILLKPSKSSEAFPFTHVEAIKLSRRENSGEICSVQVQRSENGEVMHWVRFSELIKGNRINDNVAKQALAKSSSLSLLLMKQDKEKNGH